MNQKKGKQAQPSQQDEERRDSPAQRQEQTREDDALPKKGAAQRDESDADPESELESGDRHRGLRDEGDDDLD